MTVCDLVQILKGLIDGTSYRTQICRTSQVKIGKEINNPKEVYHYFDVICDGKDVVLVPSDKWDRHKL